MHLGACDYLLKPVDPDELEASVRRAMRQIETERKLEELAAAQPQQEQTETEEEAEDAPEEGENSQTALVMAHVRRYLEDNYMFDLSLDSVGEILHISPAYLSAQFKKYQKMNFLDCLTELRINAAKELLADPFRSSAAVSYTHLDVYKRQLLGLCPAFDCLDEYRARCFVPGHWVTVCTGTESYAAKAVAIDDAGRLIVQREGGRTETLCHGEVSIRPSPLAVK